MKELNSLLFKDFEKSKMSDYSKVYGGVIATYHSHTDEGGTTTQNWDTKQTADGPETVTGQHDPGDSPIGASFQ